jgi:hypothetical protein
MLKCYFWLFDIVVEKIALIPVLSSKKNSIYARFFIDYVGEIGTAF